MDATPTGVSSHDAKIAESFDDEDDSDDDDDSPSFSASAFSAIARASPGAISHGAASCVSLHHSKYWLGTKSSRVERSCAFLK
jgi:hypothetical protein